MTVRRNLDTVTVGGGNPNPVHALAGLRPPSWTEDALCAQVDSDLFFPDLGQSARRAKAVCAQCPVTVQCLNYAIASESSAFYSFGVWGGLTPNERRQLRKGATS